ncbi:MULTISPECIES: hypothetical protein [Trueperella]|uniref:Uncharacterized protein n=1 Tax=Trueperella bernardiae TaxID=59561 RepID=A0AAW6ZHK7_9ACTO|nr:MULTISPECIES: hypothetical protein [Trueperella]MDK8602665.1 hypothetical protein [Trueperella bernardiae]MDV6239220.1 hypothetical protein [Trueperella bernardiae]WIM07209.1 hypothetical protein QPC17_05435 [Trueperella bernardiae]
MKKQDITLCRQDYHDASQHLAGSSDTIRHVARREELPETQKNSFTQMIAIKAWELSPKCERLEITIRVIWPVV